MRLRNIKFSKFLAVVSIIGLLSIFVSSIPGGFDLSSWANGVLFLVIGFALFVQGGAKFFAYFENGLTPVELARIVTVVVGVASMATGVLILPIFGFELPVLNGIKIIITSIAISVIIAEEFFV